MFNDNDIVIVSEQRSNDLGGAQTLLDIEIRGGLVEHVDVGLLHTDGTNGESLQLTTRQESDVTIHDVVKFKDFSNFFHVAEGGAA